MIQTAVVPVSNELDSWEQHSGPKTLQHILSLISLFHFSLSFSVFVLFCFFSSVSLTYFLYSSFSFHYCPLPWSFIVCRHLLTHSVLSSHYSNFIHSFSPPLSSLSSLHLLISLCPSLVSPCQLCCSICMYALDELKQCSSLGSLVGLNQAPILASLKQKCKNLLVK